MVSYNIDFRTERYFFSETPFDSLMQTRVIEVLLLCSPYDRFMLEEDGRIEEQLFQEYVSLKLRYPPRFSDAASPEEAFALLESRHFDLVITMLNFSGLQSLEIGKQIKERFPETPIVVLSRFSKELASTLENEDLSFVDHVFAWQGNANLLLAIVKLIEDQLNVEHDVSKIGVQTIILVENSVRYYSSYLPIIYRTLFRQAHDLMREGLNEHQQTMRMRGRPKILLATNYEDAVDLYQRYRKNLLGVISDIKYKRNGVSDPDAGLKLCEHIRANDPECPILLQSSRDTYGDAAKRFSAHFLYKQSKSLLKDLSHYIRNNYGFGDFIFRLPDSLEPVGWAANLVELQHQLKVIPAESLAYHAKNRHFTKWLKARAFYSLANILEPRNPADFANSEAMRDYLIDTIKNYRLHIGRGTIASYDKHKFDEFSVFQRIGNGSLGGKARGIAFADLLIKRHRIMFHFDELVIQIPKTVVLTTEVFERFMEDNGLWDFALEDRPDDEILQRFLAARLPEDVRDDLNSLLSVISKPIAVRSSSLLEDSYTQPFAGVYSTYFVPNTAPSPQRRLQQLCQAIQGVFASTYYRDSKSYAQATGNLIDEEKMAVLLQEVTGSEYQGFFFPSFSGVARSLNFYPLPSEEPEDGVAQLAVGLGKAIVDGGLSLRFSPAHPNKIMQLSSTDSTLQTTQQQFYAINLAPNSFSVTTDEAYNLEQREVQEIKEANSVRLALSSYDFQNHSIRDVAGGPGRKVVTFAPILKHQMLPIAEALQLLLQVGSQEMSTPVEIEFAVNADQNRGDPVSFKFLQIRPIVEDLESDSIAIDEQDREHALISSSKALGNGLYDDLFDIVYVKPKAFDPSKTAQMVEKIDHLNRAIESEDRGYILVGPGRWGSSDPWLGIPLKWSNITAARVIVEAGLPNFNVEPSQGSHFFQNLTSMRVAYLTINPSYNDGRYDVDFLNAQPALYEDNFLRHLRFDQALITRVDGRHSDGICKAVILRPGGKSRNI